MFLDALFDAMLQDETEGPPADRLPRHARRPAAAPSSKDIEQDSRIRALEHDNAQIKADFTALAKLLIDKGIISRQELLQVVQQARQTVAPTHVKVLPVSHQ